MRRSDIRVVHVGSHAFDSSTGPDRAVTQLVERLSSLGVETEIWHLDPANESVQNRTIGEVRVFELPSYPRPAEILRGLPAKTRAFIQSRRDQVDLVHLHSVFTPHNVWIAREAAKPYVVSPRGGYSAGVLTGRHRWIKSAWMRLYERRFLQGAAALHAVSVEESERLLDMTGHRCIVHIPNAIELPAADTGVPRARSNSRKGILFLGRLAVHQKGLDLLLKGYAQFLKSGGPDTALVIAGSDFRGGQAAAAGLSRSLSISDHVSFPGPAYREDKTRLILDSHAFVHTSRWEGLPFAVLEALSFRRPVLITPQTNLGRLVEEYGAGVVVEGTPELIANGLRRLCESDSATYDAMCVSAGRLVSERFTWEEVTPLTLDLYERALSHN